MRRVLLLLVYCNIVLLLGAVQKSSPGLAGERGLITSRHEANAPIQEHDPSACRERADYGSVHTLPPLQDPPPTNFN